MALSDINVKIYKTNKIMSSDFVKSNVLQNTLPMEV